MKSRLVNIEILRIIAMILVLVGHYNRPINGDVTFELMHTNALKAVGIAWIKSWTFVCVPCFVIISGYFGIHWKWKGILNFLFQIGFWGGLVYILKSSLGFQNFQVIPFIKSMTCFVYGVNWFITAYLGLYMFAPIINSFVEQASEKQLQWVTIAFFLYQTIFGWILKIQEFSMGMTMTSLMGYYLLGGYLRRSSLRIFQMKAKYNMMIFLIVGIFCTIVNCITQYWGFSKDVFSYISPFQVIQTAFLFLFCRSLKVQRGKKLITFFASSAFAGLLAHSWEGGGMYDAGLNWCATHFTYSFFPCMLYILLFFSLACCLDKVRIYCWNRIYAIFKK